MDIEITKKECLHKINNSMVSGRYYLYHVRFYNENKTRFRRFKFVLWGEIWEILEYFDKEKVTEKEILEYFQIMGYNFIDCNAPKDYYNYSNFLNACSNTIDDYNN